MILGNTSIGSGLTGRIEKMENKWIHYYNIHFGLLRLSESETNSRRRKLLVLAK